MTKTERQLRKLEKYIEQLAEDVGIEPSTIIEINDAIMTERIMLKHKIEPFKP